jgi:hypothetical protein
LATVIESAEVGGCAPGGLVAKATRTGRPAALSARNFSVRTNLPWCTMPRPDRLYICTMPSPSNTWW